MRLRPCLLAAALILALSGTTGWVYFHSFRSPREELLAAIEHSRPLEARLGGAGFAPYDIGAGPWLHSAATRRAARRIEAMARRRSSPRARGDLAILWLLSGRSDEAVVTLESTVAEAPQDALLLSDLAAAYLYRASKAKRPFDLVRALSAADRARLIDPAFQEALFNRALALEKLGLPQARRAWAELMSIEKDTGWKKEAETHLHGLDSPLGLQTWEIERERLENAVARDRTGIVEAIVARFPQPARIYAEETLLARWADRASTGRRDEAAADLKITRAIGSALLRRRGGDAMVHDAVAAIDEALAEASGERLRHLLAGHRLFGPGLRNYRSNDYRKAASQLAQAERELRLGRTPFARWALVYLASCEYFDDQFEPTHRRLENLRRDLPRSRYPVLVAQTAWILGSIDLLRGRPGDALTRFQEGREIYAHLGEIDRLSGIDHQIALTLMLLGRREEAWSHLFDGLRILSHLHTPRTIAGLLDEAGIICIEAGYPDVALYFQDELLSHALNRGDPGVISAARLLRAKTMLHLKRPSEAAAEIAAALRQAEDVIEEKPRRRTQAEILMARAETHLHSAPRSALTDLTTAILHFQESGYHLQLPVAFFLRARAWLAAEQTEPASQDFQVGLREIEQTGSSVRDRRLRLAFQDQAAAFFDEVLTFVSSRDDGSSAFMISERGRARQLLESLAAASLSDRNGSRRREPLLTDREVWNALQPGTVLIKYAVLEDRLLVWAFGPGGVVFRRLPVTHMDLKRSIARARAALWGGKDHASHELRTLHRQLIDPVAGVLTGAREVVFVPDREIHLLPFAALVHPASGRYLVENLAITIAPSANVYVRCLERFGRSGGKPPETALVVGATVFDRSRFPSLAPLPEAGREAELVAASYPRRQLLVGPTATERRFFAELAHGPEVIHFAGHAVPNLSFPELSLLVFAPEAGKDSSGAVYSHEIQEAHLARTRLVVLSACETAAFGKPDSEGAVGLARPFLAAGVPSVLASLAPVEDEQGKEVLTRFHVHLRAGASPAEVLRAAQLSRLAEGGEAARPIYWAMFEIIGGAPIHL